MLSKDRHTAELGIESKSPTFSPRWPLLLKIWGKERYLEGGFSCNEVGVKVGEPSWCWWLAHRSNDLGP